MCHERGLAQGDVAPVSVTCWEHTIPSRGPTDQGLQGYRVSSLLCPRYVAVTGVAKRLIQTVSGRTCTAAGRPAGSIYFRLACAPAARGARPRACHLAAAASVQIWVVSTVLLLYGTAQRSELLSVVAPDHYRSGSRVVTGSCDPQPQQQPCIQPQNCCCWPRGRARGLSI